jgi:glycopeptide antibiotics resistance protein
METLNIAAAIAAILSLVIDLLQYVHNVRTTKDKEKR